MTDMDADISACALDWYRAGRGAAIASLVTGWSAAPFAAGRQMVFDADGAAFGSLTGGCIEQALKRTRSSRD
ncbi:MAG: XdhC family protein [Pseudomonadota bacterium]